MNCQELDRLLYPYLDGEFQPEERMDVENHLEECEDCTLRVDQEREIQQTLRRAARHSVHSQRAPASLRLGIEGGIKREQRRASQFQWLRMSAAALVLAAVGGGWVALHTEQRQRFADEAARRHAKRLPFEISNVSPEHVEEWFQDKLEHQVDVPRFQNARLAGARLSNVKDRTAAYIAYETSPGKQGEEGHRISVFVFDDAGRDLDARALPAMQVDATQSYNVAVWRDGEVVYELVSDLTEAEIRKLVLDRERSSRRAHGQAATRMPADIGSAEH
jgi:anti-sigma factor (TIGR02949 family)